MSGAKSKSESANDETNRAETNIEERIERENAYKSAEVLEYLYWDEELSQYAIADRLGISQKTVLRWMEKHDIGRRDRIEAAREARRVERATYDIDNGGYPRWQSFSDGEITTVRVHSLLAISDGADPAEVFSDGVYHCHHACPIPWLNIGSFIDVLPAGDHQQTHVEDEWTQQDGIPALVSQTDS